MRKIAARNFVQFPQYPAEGSRLKSARNEWGFILLDNDFGKIFVVLYFKESEDDNNRSGLSLRCSV